MSKGAFLRITKSRSIPNPSIYIQKMYQEYSDFVFDEEESPKQKGRWRQDVFTSSKNSTLHLEIGTGTGLHIAQQALSNSKDSFIGIELKYKPLIQTIRRCLQNKSENVRMLRYNATLIQDLFQSEEVNNIYIHFPDPWPKQRHSKHRLIQPEFIKNLYQIQKQESILEIKTDSREYFDFSCSIIENSKLYNKVQKSHHWHREVKKNVILTGFERLFMKKDVPICFAQYKRA